MELKNLKLNRTLQKDPNQSESTKNSVFSSNNPEPKIGGDDRNNWNFQKDGGSKQVLTGTVITSCFIQTSALPSRVEMSGNNITFFDDTVTRNGRVEGDTARLSFTHDLNSEEGFIMEKRASVNDTYDNVLSWFSTPPKEKNNVNYLFIGRDGRENLSESRNLGYLEITSNESSDRGVSSSNGRILMEVTVDQQSVAGNLLITGAGSLSEGKTGILAQLSGIGDGGTDDEGAAAIAYIDKNTLSILYYIAVSKTGVQIVGLPTSSAGLPSGSLWRDGSNFVKIVP